MTDIRQLHRALISRVLGDDATAPAALRRFAFEADLAEAGCGEPLRTLIEKVAYHSEQVTDADFAAVRATGLSEDQIFEVVVCAAIGQADRQYTNALAALADATGEAGSLDEA